MSHGIAMSTVRVTSSKATSTVIALPATRSWIRPRANHEILQVLAQRDAIDLTAAIEQVVHQRDGHNALLRIIQRVFRLTLGRERGQRDQPTNDR